MERRAESLRVQYPEILRFVRRRVDSETETEDVTQEAFVSAAEALARSSEAAPPTLAWLYTVARRRLVDEARRRRTDMIPLELVRETAAPEDEYGGLVGRALGEGLDTLSETLRSGPILLEWDRGTETQERLEEKLRRYRLAEHKLRHEDLEPRSILIVVPGRRRLQTLHQTCAAAFDGDGDWPVVATTANELRQAGPLAPVWRRLGAAGSSSSALSQSSGEPPLKP